MSAAGPAEIRNYPVSLQNAVRAVFVDHPCLFIGLEPDSKHHTIVTHGRRLAEQR